MKTNVEWKYSANNLANIEKAVPCALPAEKLVTTTRYLRRIQYQLLLLFLFVRTVISSILIIILICLFIILTIFACCILL